ncbi:MAG: sigma-70 family RNA polymerase sigma factor [Solimonas sp.]
MNDAATLQVFLAHRAALVDYAASIVGSRERAEDIVQDAWLRFAAAAQPDVAQPAHYLYRIVRNLALDTIRRQALENRYAAPFDEAAECGDGRPSPEAQAVTRDELRAAAEALAELPERTRHAFELVRLHGESLQQAALRLGVSVSLVHQLVRSALMHCEARLRAGQGRAP